LEKTAAQRIRSYIDGHGLKQKFICEKSGITRQALSAMLNGGRGIYAEDILALCNALNCTPNDLLMSGGE
jgi:DNA-binding Xre family transcriptional regulator